MRKKIQTKSLSREQLIEKIIIMKNDIGMRYSENRIENMNDVELKSQYRHYKSLYFFY